MNESSGLLEIQVRLFGAFRQCGNGNSVSVTVAAEATVADVKKALAACLGTADLVASSAIADETRVLADHERITGKTRLAVLPPVCGG